MKKITKFIMLLCITIGMISCGTDFSMEFPQGPKGDIGLSAYDLWVDGVTKGNIDWDINYITINDFFVFLTGKQGIEGKQGIQGIPGVQGIQGITGQSAYDLWVNMVLLGLKNPHDPETNWSKLNTSEQDFMYFLTGTSGKDGENGINGTNGKDGKSAYDIWVISVIDGIPNPHKPGTNWPKSKISECDFFTYLTGARGADGKNGIDGKDGKSAYDLWVIEVKKGNLYDKSGKVWSTKKISIQDYFYYFMGADGKDGINGKNGVDGLSAYELWKIEVINGINHPFIPDSIWPINETSMQDFFRFLRGVNGIDGVDGINGSDGKSAYELWIYEVSLGLENPHDPGVNWIYTETSLEDFWRYLRGKDGNDGKDGQTGQPGLTIVVVSGVPNVICQYQKQEYNEFIRESDGAAVYYVYNEKGNLAPFAIVKGLPGIVNPDKEYTADKNGMFIVPKEDLPINLPAINRNGVTASVSYTNYDNEWVTEMSAPNTYVPLKMQIRIRLTAAPNISSSAGNIYLTYVIERRVDPNLAWERIPAYLGSLSQPIKVYEISNNTNPYSYTTKTYYSASQNISTVTAISVGRLTKRCNYLTETWQTSNLRLWDNNEHYMSLMLDSYYGEKPNADVVIKMAPIQLMPLIKNIKVGAYTSFNTTFASIQGDFDISNIDYSLLFDNTFIATNKSGYVYYEAVITNKDIADTKLPFSITFTKTISSVNWTVTNTPKESIKSPDWNIPIDVYLDSAVTIGCNITGMFYTPASIGNLRSNGSGGYQITPTTATGYNVPIIPVTFK